MRIIISIIVSAVIIGGVFGYIVGHHFADAYPYSLKQEKEYLAKEYRRSLPELLPTDTELPTENVFQKDAEQEESENEEIENNP